MIDAISELLSSAGLTPDLREMRDALWLSQHLVPVVELGRLPAHQRTPVSLGGEVTGDAEADTPNVADQGATDGPSNPRPGLGDAVSESTTSTSMYASGGVAEPIRGSAVRSPAVPALLHKAEIARAMRPLRRRSP